MRVRRSGGGVVADLRAVGENGKPTRRPAARRPAAPRKPAAKKPMTLAAAIDSGDYLEILRAQRRDIATSLPAERGPAKAALHRQLSQVSKEIEDLEARKRQEDTGGNVETSDGKFDAEAI